MTFHRNVWIGTDAAEGPEREAIWRIPHPAPGAGGGAWDQSPLVRATEAPRPTFLAVHPAADRLYALSEQSRGSVTSYSIGTDCALTHPRRIDTGGSNPCHLRVHPQGQWLYVANYGDGTLTAIELNDAGDVAGDVLTFHHSGSGPDPERQEGPHAHATRISPGGGYLMVADLGTDEIRAYPLDAGRPEPEPVITSLPPGTGPRHFAGKGSHLYISAELSSEVLVLEWDEGAGRGEVIQRIPATGPMAGEGNYPSHILFSGGVVLVASRGANVLTTFAVAEGGARLEHAGDTPTARWPRHMAVTGSEVLVAGQQQDEVWIHPFHPDGLTRESSGAVGEVRSRLAIPRPMFILPM